MGLIFQLSADRRLVKNPIGLGAGGAYRRPLGTVEDAKLNPPFVCGQRHGAAQCIHFFDQMTLANAADRGVAAHLPQGLDVVGQEQGFATHASGCQGGLRPGVTTADHNHIKCLGVQHDKLPWAIAVNP